jgi:cell division protein FtsB
MGEHTKTILRRLQGEIDQLRAENTQLRAQVKSLRESHRQLSIRYQNERRKAR